MGLRRSDVGFHSGGWLWSDLVGHPEGGTGGRTTGVQGQRFK